MQADNVVRSTGVFDLQDLYEGHRTSQGIGSLPTQCPFPARGAPHHQMPSDHVRARCQSNDQAHEQGKKLAANLTCPSNPDGATADGCYEGGRLSSKACFHVEVC